MNNPRLYGLIAILGASLAASLILVSVWMSSLSLGIYPSHWGPPIEEKITIDVSVNRTSPLILNLNMTSSHNSDVEFHYGYVENENQTTIAQCPRNVPYGSSSNERGYYAQHFIVCILPANSTRTVPLTFNVTLPSGEYRIRFNLDDRYVHTIYSNYFAIP